MNNLRIDIDRLMTRLRRLAEIGALEGGGVCRIALTEEDRDGRELVLSWMHELDLETSVDRMGNIVGMLAGSEEDAAPVMTGSHIDTVATGGIYDGNLGVLAGLEVIETLRDAGITPRRPLAVGVFTNEEGVRFSPDMMGSLVYNGGMTVEEAHAAEGIDGTTVGQALEAIGYLGELEPDVIRPAAFIELHIEQGPLLERDGVTIGAVEGVQGISWTEVTFTGTSNHAGTTPMALRHDAGLAAARTSCFLRRLAEEMGGTQVATVGSLTLRPNLVNVIPNRAVMTADLRNMDDAQLTEAEGRLDAFLEDVAAGEGCTVETRRLVRFAPVIFEPEMVDRVVTAAQAQGRSVKRMPSGAGHDAQMFARNCPTGMIFVPSARGISHNIEEHTEEADIEAGANVLLTVLTGLAGVVDSPG